MPDIIEVAESIRTQVQTALSIEIQRRYGAYFAAGEVRDGKYVLVAAGEDIDAKRGIDIGELTVDVGYQIALPEPTSDYPDPAENVPWCDVQLRKILAVKQLFAPEDEGTVGLLRDASFAGAKFVRSTHSPLFRPEMMRDNQIFTSVVRLELRDQRA